MGKGSQGLEELTARRGVEILSFLEQKAGNVFKQNSLDQTRDYEGGKSTSYEI